MSHHAPKQARLQLDEGRLDAAKSSLENGPVTPSYGPYRDDIVKLLNDALATELVCTLRYRHDYFMARGIDSQAAADEFLEHAKQELDHADRIAGRIVQLGGEPRMDPGQLTARSHSEYRTGRTVQEAIRENLVAERIAIDSYREMVQYLGDRDPTTRRMLEEILAVEEEHADDLAELLGSSSTPVKS